nr:hypothetical protein [Kibdelosporangium sp. MJ126-NF4]CTQ89431.1 hypothetical protein [Kibdelosporangium sp. MJ126-NF4]
MTSTARAPRESTTNTVAPLGSGSSENARNVSEPPRILISTSPGPRPPRVPTTRTPIDPTGESSVESSLMPLHGRDASASGFVSPRTPTDR